MILFQLGIALLISAQISRAAPAVDSQQVIQKVQSAGFTLSLNDCKPMNLVEGKGQVLSFLEVTLECRDLLVQLEISYPFSTESMTQQMRKESAMIEELYSASKNPYAGYISETTQCPLAKNFWRDSNPSLLFGRLTERGAWGGCGRGQKDRWGALAFITHKDKLAKMTIRAKTGAEKSRFVNDARKLSKNLSGR